jgi:hypothetical protein
MTIGIWMKIDWEYWESVYDCEKVVSPETVNKVCQSNNFCWERVKQQGWRKSQKQSEKFRKRKRFRTFVKSDESDWKGKERKRKEKKRKVIVHKNEQIWWSVSARFKQQLTILRSLIEDWRGLLSSSWWIYFRFVFFQKRIEMNDFIIEFRTIFATTLTLFSDSCTKESR